MSAPALSPNLEGLVGDRLLDLEPQLRRIKNYEALPLLQQALHQDVENGKKSAA